MTPTVPEPPSNLDAEESLLGALMLNGAMMAAVLETGIDRGHFYRASHGAIYGALQELYGRGSPTDAISVIDFLGDTVKDAGGPTRIHELASLVPAASNAPHYATIVRDLALTRRIQAAGTTLRNAQPGPGETAQDLLEQAEALIFDLAQSGTRRGDWVGMETAIADAHRRIREAHESGRAMTGLPSGFTRIDALTSGWQPGNLIVIAARPSVGKTALVLGAAAHAAVAEEVPVGFFTVEMSTLELTERLISMHAYVDATAIRNGRLDAEGWKRVNDAAGKLERAPLFIDDSAATMIEIRAKARRLKLRQPNLGMIVVDYLQLLSFGGDGRYEGREKDVSAVSRSLKALAGELQIPVIALSQLSRAVEQRHDKRPILSDLRESGAVEQDADLVAFIYRDEYYNPEDTDQHGIAEVNLAKHRNGPTGMVKLAFVSRHANFTDLAPG